MSEPTIFDALADIANELYSARMKFPPMHSAHEGYAVLKEELDELCDAVDNLWDAVKTKGTTRAEMRKEAVQVGAMALSFIMDVDAWDLPGEDEGDTNFDTADFRAPELRLKDAPASAVLNFIRGLLVARGSL